MVLQCGCDHSAALCCKLLLLLLLLLLQVAALALTPTAQQYSDKHYMPADMLRPAD
jgi:hypothetical protein